MRSILHTLIDTLIRRKPNIISIASEHQITSNSYFSTDDRITWRDRWLRMGQPWRTEPEIDRQRQEYLAQRRAIIPDNQQGIYPFKDLKLSRADVEWLLATHEDGRGPVDWSDESQRERDGLDLRGADLCYVDLHKLPLTCILGGLTQDERLTLDQPQCEKATILMDGALLRGVHLEKAILNAVHLEGATLYDAYLEMADLHEAHLEGAFLNGAYLKNATLNGAYLKNATLNGAYLKNATLIEAHLESATLIEANLKNADLSKAHLEGADLIEVHLEGANLSYALLGGATLSLSFFDNATRLEGLSLFDTKHGFATLADVSWGDANLAVINWSQVKMLGDEYTARMKNQINGEIKEIAIRLHDYEASVRANRQLAVALREQGLNENASYFAYRAQVLQKSVLRFQMLQPRISLLQRLRLFGSWFFSWFLFLLAGYGYRPGRSIIAYLLMIGIFALAYFALGITASGTYHLQWYEALVVSLTAFHGRGFFSEQFKPGDPQAFVAAIEAVVGLVIEISFIATFTQRFFGK
jgi:uncharacterized protein YjbI with pentapeptide repeats